MSTSNLNGKGIFRVYAIALTVFFVSSLNLRAQHHTHGDSHTGCGTDHVHQQLFDRDSDYRRLFVENQKAIRNRILENDHGSGDRQRSNEPYVIPVVFHILHLGEPVGVGSNISDAQIMGALNGLNDRFSGAVGSSTDVGIQFCLATIDPSGCPTNGINRVNASSVPGYANGAHINNYDDQCGAHEFDLKDLSKWPVLDYYNIWIVHDICGSIAGFAYYPWGGQYDGTMQIASETNYNSLVLAHELGHGFFVFHTFEGDEDGGQCPPNNECLEEGDYVCDTPPHRRNDCGSSNPCSGSGVWNNSRRNYMSYCFPSLNQGRFTPGQKDRMLATLETFPRENLLNSFGCANEPLTVTATSTSICAGQSVTLTAVSPFVDTFSWSTGASATSITVSPTVTTTYTVSGVTSGGCPVSASVTILVQPSPSISASSNSPIQEGMNLTLVGSATQGALVNWTGPNGFFTLVQNPTLTNVTTNQSGTYCATATLNGCSAQSCTQVVIEAVNPCQPPVAATSISSTEPFICEGDATVLTVNGGSTGTDGWWEWYAGSCGGEFAGIGTSRTVNPTQTTTYFARAVNACGTTACVSYTVIVNPIPPAPSPTASANSGCIGDHVNLAANTLADSYNWQGPIFNSVLQNPTVVLEPQSFGVYNLFVTQNGCTSAAGSVTINQSPTPGNVTITGSGIHCGSTILTASGGNGGTIYWQGTNPNGTATTSPSTMQTIEASGTYYFRALSQSGCWGPPTSAFVTILALPFTTASSNSPVTLGTAIQLSATGPGGNAYEWTGPNNFNSSQQNPIIDNATVGMEGEYCVTPINVLSGCVGHAQCTTVTLNEPCGEFPIIAPDAVDGETLICAGTEVTLSIIGGSLGIDGQWHWYEDSCGEGTAVATGPTINVTPQATTTYFVRAEGPCGVSECASVTVSVVAAPEPITIEGPTEVCLESYIYSVNPQPNITDYLWTISVFGLSQQQSTGTTPEVSLEFGDFLGSQVTLLVEAFGECGTVSSAPITIEVFNDQAPEMQLDGPALLCSSALNTFTILTESEPDYVTWSINGVPLTTNDPLSADIPLTCSVLAGSAIAQWFTNACALLPDDFQCLSVVPQNIDTTAPCFAQVVQNDPFCCNSQWDALCDQQYNNCIEFDECSTLIPDLNSGATVSATVGVGCFTTTLTQWVEVNLADHACACNESVTEPMVVALEEEANALIESVLFSDCGITSNIDYQGIPAAIGSFTANCGLGLTSGMILTTGLASNANGPNNQGLIAAAHNEPGYALLSDLVGVPTYDAAVISFDLMAIESSYSFQYVFGSEELLGYTCDTFNDVFAIFVSGPGIDGTVNIAVTPGTELPITIDNLSLTCGNNGDVSLFEGSNCTEYNFYTEVLEASFETIPGETYTVVMAIADALDNTGDSGVFIAPITTSGSAELTVDILGPTIICSDASIAYEISGADLEDGLWSFTGEGSLDAQEASVVLNASSSGTLSFISDNACGTISGMLAIEVVDLTSATSSLTIEGDPDLCEGITAEFSLTPAVPFDVSWAYTGVGTILPVGSTCELTATSAGTLSAALEVPDGCQTAIANAEITVIPASNIPDIATEIADVNPGEEVTFTAVNYLSVEDFNVEWSTGETTTSITVSPDTTTVYTLTLSAACGEAKTGQFIVAVIGESAPNATPSLIVTPETSALPPGECVELNGSVINAASTNDYAVNAIPCTPLVSLSAGEQMNDLIGVDDGWGAIRQLPFEFCFYGDTYTEYLVSSNGKLSFDLSYANGFSPFIIEASCPSTELSLNTIFGVYNDYSGCVAPKLLTLGEAPFRKLVINFHNQCNYWCYNPFTDQTKTSVQLVLHETSNAIDVFIIDKPSCGTGIAEASLVGIQNASGSAGVTPPNRNTGFWSATAEAWRFTPIGEANVNVQWFDAQNALIGEGPSITVCPTVSTEYTAMVTGDSCLGLAEDLNAVASVTINLDPNPVCLGDFNNDLVVNVADLLILLANFGCSSNCLVDLSGSESTGASDLLIFLALFGNDCN